MFPLANTIKLLRRPSPRYVASIPESTAFNAEAQSTRRNAEKCDEYFQVYERWPVLLFAAFDAVVRSTQRDAEKGEERSSVGRAAEPLSCNLLMLPFRALSWPFLRVLCVSLALLLPLRLLITPRRAAAFNSEAGQSTRNFFNVFARQVHRIAASFAAAC